jgi:hypothetical protein
MEIGKCSVSTCKASGVKVIPVPRTPDDTHGFDVIYVCEYHIERFDELYQEIFRDFYEDTESVR